ncbi:unnamed protein product [Cylicocyclus nassatus]|uniref:Serpentine receptor class gamma n=1 Tax=Cylicocyclus nassatus TaxID=53992 RepID=A0AA36GGF3_CYLNA|nr:unnamed protein product [Cylicocyclus nassatus]
MPFFIALIILCIIVLTAIMLCSAILLAMWQERKSSRYKTFFYKSWWNEGFINLFTFIFFLLTMYARCFSNTAFIFLYLNRYPWWTKFAQITVEHVLCIQIMNVLLTVAARFFNLCLPLSRIALVAEKLGNWQIFVLQAFVPTLVVIPLYALFDFQYGLDDVTTPLLLRSPSVHYDQIMLLIGLIYRVAALVLCVFVYISLFWTVRKKAKRSETNILIYGGCLLLALAAVVLCTICRGFRIGEDEAFMRLFYLTLMLWIPCTDILMTICVITPVRESIFKRFKKFRIIFAASTNGESS